MTARNQHELWVDVVERRKADFLKLKVSIDLHVDSMERFRAAMDDLSRRYSSKTGTRFFLTKVAPYMEHIQSFSTALNSISQGLPFGSLVWGGLQVVLECGCRFSSSLDDTLEWLDKLHNLLPDFHAYIDLYAVADNGLEAALRDIYDDYLELCIHHTEVMSSGAFRNILRNVYSSKRKAAFKKLVVKIQNHREVFEAKATLASRLRSERNHEQVMSRIAPITAVAVRSVQPTFMLPYRRNKFFFGREETLDTLHSLLTGEESRLESVSCVLHGMGGVGKTQTAIEYAYRYYMRYFQCVFWLPAEDPVALDRAYGEIGKELGLFTRGCEVGQKEKEEIMGWLRSTDQKWLLIFDNVESWERISGYWPTTAQAPSAVIVTTQKPAALTPWSTHHISVSHFDSNLGAEFLLWQLKIENPTDHQKEEAQSITKLAGGLPLYLAHIGGHISHSQLSMGEYLKAFRASSNLWQNKSEDANWQYDKTVGTVFDVALAELSTNARHLLYVLAFLNPDGVAESCLFPNNDAQRLEYLGSHTTEEFLSITADLHNRQLVKRENPGPDRAMFTTHRSVQEGILGMLNRSSEERSSAFQCAFTIVRRLVPRASFLLQAEPEKWKVTEPHMPQLLSLCRAFSRSSPRISAPYAFAELLYDVGMNMWDRGLTEDGQQVLRTAEEVLDRVGCPEENSLRANIHIVLALILEHVGISARREALERRKKGYAIRKAIYDRKPEAERTHDDEVLIYAAYVDMARSYAQCNDFENVRIICEEAKQKYDEWGDHTTIPFEYSKYYRLTAFAFAYEGDTAQAVANTARSAELQRAADPDALLASMFRFDWVIMLFRDNQRQKAIQHLHEISEFRERACGKNAFLTLQVHIALGVFYFFQEDYQSALPILRDVLRPEAKATLNEEDIVRVQYYISESLYHQSLSDGIPISEAAEAERRKVAANMLRLVSVDPPVTDDCKPYDNSALCDYLVAAEFRIAGFEKRGELTFASVPEVPQIEPEQGVTDLGSRSKGEEPLVFAD